VPEAVAGAAAASGKMALGLLYGVLLILLGWGAVAALRLLPAPSHAAATAAALLACACSFGPSLGVEKHRLWGSPETTFLHAGVGAGPILYTDSTGQVVEERRYEPFGEEIDARVLQGGTYVVGDPDLVARDLNVLNKRTEVTTGWSDHGARWMAPETGRWLTPDPPVKGPDPEFLESPWALHPYQYVEQNPVANWDPDGRRCAGVTCGYPPSASEEQKAELRAAQFGPPKSPTEEAERVARLVNFVDDVATSAYNGGDLAFNGVKYVFCRCAQDDWNAARRRAESAARDLKDRKHWRLERARSGDAARGGESAAAAAGRRAHGNYGTALGPDYDVRVTLPSGKKPDAVNWANREVRELKPDNPSAVRRGQKQVEGYRKELEEVTGEPWTSEVDVYRSGGR
jgi:RHS repeat-associated protein